MNKLMEEERRRNSECLRTFSGKSNLLSSIQKNFRLDENNKGKIIGKMREEFNNAYCYADFLKTLLDNLADVHSQLHEIYFDLSLDSNPSLIELRQITNLLVVYNQSLAQLFESLDLTDFGHWVEEIPVLDTLVTEAHEGFVELYENNIAFQSGKTIPYPNATKDHKETYGFATFMEEDFDDEDE